MDRGEPSLKPEWLLRGVATPTVSATSPRPGTSPRADDQDRGTSPRNRPSGRDRERSSQQSSIRRGSGPSVSRRHDRDGTVKSRGYASFGRSNRDRVCEKESDFCDWEGRLGLPDDPLRDGFGSFSSCRPESDRLNRIRPKLDTLNQAAGVSLDNVNLSSSKDTSGVSFEREFPHLSSEDNNGKQDIGIVPSPGICTPIHNIPLVSAPDGWNSVLAEVPGLGEPSNNHVSSALSRPGSSRQLEVTNCVSTLSMAETVMQTPSKASSTPQLSIDAQKIEERTLRQCTLRPLTPSSNKISVSSLSDKLKIKGARAGDSNGPVKAAQQLSSQPSNSSVRAVKSELVKPSQSGSFQVLTREQNGAANTVKDCSSDPMSPVLGRSFSVEPLKKPIANQKLKGATNGLPLHLQQGSSGERKASAKDKHKFFELLRSKSLNGSRSCIESSSSLIDEQKSPSLDLSLFNSGIKRIETGTSSWDDANSCDGSQRPFSDNEADKAEAARPIIPTDKKDASVKSDSSYDETNLSVEPIVAWEEEPYPTEDEPSPEEMAFLKSLGWKEDEIVAPLKQEEIADCLKHNLRLQQKLEECRG